MSLKLFTPSEAKQLNTAQIERDLARKTELQEEVRNLQIQLADAEASFNSALARQRDVWAKEEKEYAERFSTMELEVKRLEKRKAEALIPIAEIEKVAHTKANEAETRLSEVLEKEKEVDFLKEGLIEKIDNVQEQAQLLEQQAHKLLVRSTAVQQEEESLKNNRESLTESIAKFNLYIKEQQATLSRQKTDIILRERSIEARNKLLIDKEKQLQDKEIRLRSERFALDTAWNEYKTMNPNDAINYPNVEIAASADGSNQPIESPVEAVEDPVDVVEATPEVESIEVEQAPVEESPQEPIVDTPSSEVTE